MWAKHLIIFFIFFLLAALQVSILPYVALWGVIPNTLFIGFYIITFFEEKYTYQQGFVAAVLGGFFADIVLSAPFGISIAAFLIAYFLHKLIAYFLREVQDTYSLLYFAPLFLVHLLIYSLTLYIFSLLFSFEFTSGVPLIIHIIYSVLLASLGFFVYKKIAKQRIQNKQLKLL